MKIVKELKMEEFGIKCMEKMFKRIEKKREEMGEGNAPVATTTTRSKTAPRRVALDKESLGQSTERKKHVANMHIDVVPDSMKSKRLNGAIKMCTDKVFESRAVTPWRYTGFKVVASEPGHYREPRDERVLAETRQAKQAQERRQR